MKITESQIRTVIKQELVKILNEMDETGMVPRAPSEIPEVMPVLSEKDEMLKIANDIKTECMFYGDPGADIPANLLTKIEIRIDKIIKFLKNN